MFSGVADNFENLHTRLPIAIEMGFADVVVQGLTTVCWLSEHLLRWAGPTWLSSGVLNATFLKPMLANQPLRLRAVVSGRTEEDGDKSIELEAWTLDEQGDKTAVATAYNGNRIAVWPALVTDRGWPRIGSRAAVSRRTAGPSPTVSFQLSLSNPPMQTYFRSR